MAAPKGQAEGATVRLVGATSGGRVRAFGATTLFASSSGLCWPGMRVEAGQSDGFCASEARAAWHQLAINLSAEPLSFVVHGGPRARRVVMAPGSLWLCPAGETFSHCVAAPSTLGVVLLAPERVERAAGVFVRPPRRYALRDAAIEHVVRALVAEAGRGGENGVAFADALATALAVRLARVSGARLGPARPSGALPARRLGPVLDLIESRLERGVSLDELASLAGLSPFHFARSFKRATGTSPHRFLLERRLEHARAALERRAEPISAISARLGFADQSHFTRLFKRRYGTTPAASRR